MLQFCFGVVYLYDNWIFYWDFKMLNLLLNNRGQLKIVDFGMLRYVGDLLLKLMQLVVMLWYCVLELLFGVMMYGSVIDIWSVGCIFGEFLVRELFLQGRNEVDEFMWIFELCGLFLEELWFLFWRLLNVRGLRLLNNLMLGLMNLRIRIKFLFLMLVGVGLFNGLFVLDLERRLVVREVLEYEYFWQDFKLKQEVMFFIFLSKVGQERRRKREMFNVLVRG